MRQNYPRTANNSRLFSVSLFMMLWIFIYYMTWCWQSTFSIALQTQQIRQLSW